MENNIAVLCDKRKNTPNREYNLNLITESSILMHLLIYAGVWHNLFNNEVIRGVSNLEAILRNLPISGKSTKGKILTLTLI